MKKILILLFLIPLFLAQPAEAKKTKAKRKVATHRVAKGETLYGISRKAGMSVDELKRLNGLKGNTIKPGMVLRLKGKVATARSVAKKQKDPADHSVVPEAFCDISDTVPRELPSAKGELEEVAMAFLATPYRFGAEDRNSTDCSGFTQQVFRQLGLELPRTAREQFRLGEKVPAGEWQRGDLLFFRTYARYPSHVGIYLQDGKMIHASRNKRRVIISDIDLPYFRKRYLGARRIAAFNPVATLIDGLFHNINEINEEGILEADADVTSSSSAIPSLPIPDSSLLPNLLPADR